MNHLLWVALQDHTAKQTINQRCHQNNEIFRLNYDCFQKCMLPFVALLYRENRENRKGCGQDQETTLARINLKSAARALVVAVEFSVADV